MERNFFSCSYLLALRYFWVWLPRFATKGLAFADNDTVCSYFEKPYMPVRQAKMECSVRPPSSDFLSPTLCISLILLLFYFFPQPGSLCAFARLHICMTARLISRRKLDKGRVDHGSSMSAKIHRLCGYLLNSKCTARLTTQCVQASSLQRLILQAIRSCAASYNVDFANEDCASY